MNNKNREQNKYFYWQIYEIVTDTLMICQLFRIHQNFLDPTTTVLTVSLPKLTNLMTTKKTSFKLNKIIVLFFKYQLSYITYTQIDDYVTTSSVINNSNTQYLLTTNHSY